MKQTFLFALIALFRSAAGQTGDGYSEEGNIEDPTPSERAAVYGHSDIPANPKGGHYFEPIQQQQPPFNNYEEQDLSQGDFSPYGGSQDVNPFVFPPNGAGFNPNFDPDTAPFDPNGVPFNASPALNPERGLAFLDYVRGLLENYPVCPACDATSFSGCTCAYPAQFSDDGRGNCNVGSTKPDLKVWCYVDASAGNPQETCPDSRPSKSKPGLYWSRIACITD